jgi:hypothetical protein
MADESPFGKASVMSGYPLDEKEKAAVEKTIKSSTDASSYGSGKSVSGKYGSRKLARMDEKQSNRRRRLFRDK